MVWLFKSKKEKFVEEMDRYLSKLIKKAEARGALYILAEKLEPILGNNIYRPTFSQYYDEIAEDKDIQLNLSLLKHDFIMSIILHEAVRPRVASALPVLSRKRRTLITPDDYGDYQFDKWFKELDFFYDKKLDSEIEAWLDEPKNIELLSDDVHFSLDLLDEILFPYVKLFIWNMVSEYDENNPSDITYDEDMSGHEYEFYVAEQFENQGFVTQVTKGSGDHGVDVLAECADIRLAIQCKHYNSAVNNKAVQEVYSAKDIFDCNLAAVVTNNVFTPAAKEAANKLGVYLLHHEDIPDFCSLIVDNENV